MGRRKFPNKLPVAVIHENELLAAKAKLALIITNYGVIMNFGLNDWKKRICWIRIRDNILKRDGKKGKKFGITLVKHPKMKKMKKITVMQF